jgi:CheY-like chemotaxis protein
VDLVMMDCQMPTMDGYDTTRRIRAAEEVADPPRHLPVVAMTANALTGDREKCLQAGMDDYLVKPLEFAAMRRALEPWVRLRDGRHHSKGLSYAGGQLDVDPAFELGDVVDPKATAEQSLGEGDAEAPLDGGKLADLQSLMGEELPRLVRNFLDTAPPLVQALDQAAAAGDVAAMVHPAHTLKSSSANVAAQRLSDMADKLEEDARSGRDAAALKACPKVAAEFEAAKAALQSLLA